MLGVLPRGVQRRVQGTRVDQGIVLEECSRLEESVDREVHRVRGGDCTWFRGGCIGVVRVRYLFRCRGLLRSNERVQTEQSEHVTEC